MTKRTIVMTTGLFITFGAGVLWAAGTVDQTWKALPQDGIKIQDQTRDACDRGDNITITSTTDGNVVLKPQETRYFKINKDQDDYTRSGGWYWKCGNSPERARIKGSSVIRAERKENGVTDWFWVTYEP